MRIITCLALSASIVGCTGKKVAKEAQLIDQQKQIAIEAIDQGKIRKLSGSVGMIEGAEYRISELEVKEVEGVPLEAFSKKTRNAIADRLVSKWDAFEADFTASSDRYEKQTIREYFAKTDHEVSKRFAALKKKLESRLDLLVRGASTGSAPQVVSKFQKSHPQFRWIAAEGPRKKDKEAKVDVILDFSEETDASKLVSYKETDGSGAQQGHKLHAFSGYGLQLAVHFVERKAPEGIETPVLFRDAERLEQPKTFHGTSRDSAKSQFHQHQMNAMRSASTRLHEKLTNRFLAEIASKWTTERKDQ